MFIGAASERDALVAAMKRVLDHPPGQLVVRSWRDVFDEAGASKTTIEVLAHAAAHYDFGIFLLSPEDVTILRNREVTTSRGNVVLEFGIFLGALGRERTFAFVPDTLGTELPTDLAGVDLFKWTTADEEVNPSSAVRGDAEALRAVLTRRGAKSLSTPRVDGAPAEVARVIAPAPGDGWAEAAREDRLLPAQGENLYGGDHVVHRRFGAGVVRETYPGEHELYVRVQFARGIADMPISQLRLPRFR